VPALKLTPDLQSKIRALSTREKRVLLLYGEGYPTVEIAAKLRIAVKSVETYKLRATRKLTLEKSTDYRKVAWLCALQEYKER